eukprot:479615_1
MLLLIAWANNTNNNYKFGYHGPENVLIHIIDLDCHNGSIEYPNDNVSISKDVDIKYTPLIVLNEESGIYMSVKLQKSTDLLTINLIGPNDVWFGISFGDHYNGDSFLYTTGLLNEENEPYAFDYVLRGELIGSTDENYKDAKQDWIIEEIVNFDVNGTVKIIANRKLNTGDNKDDIQINFDDNVMILYVSHGIKSAKYPFKYAYHGSNYWIVSIDLLAGNVEEIDTENIVFKNIDHIMFMAISCLFVIPIGLLLKINNITLFIGYLGIICGFTVKLAQLNGLDLFNENNNFNSKFHKIFGFIFILLLTVIICIGYILKKK